MKLKDGDKAYIIKSLIASCTLKDNNTQQFLNIIEDKQQTITTYAFTEIDAVDKMIIQLAAHKRKLREKV